MKKTLVALVIAAMASASAFADPVTNTNPTYDVKVQYRVAGKVYGASSEVSGPYDSATASTAPFDEVYVAPGKTVNVPGKTIKVITMTPGPDTSWMSAMDKIG